MALHFFLLSALEMKNSLSYEINLDFAFVFLLFFSNFMDEK